MILRSGIFNLDRVLQRECEKRQTSLVAAAPPLINRTLAWPLSLQRGTNVHLFDKNKYAFALGKFLHAIQSLHHPPLYDLPH